MISCLYYICPKCFCQAETPAQKSERSCIITQWVRLCRRFAGCDFFIDGSFVSDHALTGRRAENSVKHSSPVWRKGRAFRSCLKITRLFTQICEQAGVYFLYSKTTNQNLSEFSYQTSVIIS